jgi:hypothetical protein
MSDPTKTTIIGSYKRHWEDIKNVRRVFLRAGVEVLRPVSDKIIEGSGDWVRVEGDPAEAQMMRERQLDAIRHSDFVYVVNPGGYIGNAGQLECGYALALQVPIHYMELPYDSAAAPGQVGRPQHVLRQLSRDQLAPADQSLVEDFVQGDVQIGRRAAQLQIQGTSERPVLAHEEAGPLALRTADMIELRPLTHHLGRAARLQLIVSAYQHRVQVREEQA